MTKDDVFEGVSPRDRTTDTPEDPIRSSLPAESDDLSYSKEAYSEKKAIPDPHAVDTSSNPSGQDVEAGEGRFAGVKAQARHYKKLYLKHVLLAVTWLLFTG
jgi:CNT family concentrative nucleoside transporter